MSPLLLRSSSFVEPDLVAPRYLTVPEYEGTLGPHVAAVSTLAGFAPDPEQRILLDGAFGLDRSGKPAAFAVVVIAPRQNLKTGFLKQYSLGQLFVVSQHLSRRDAQDWLMVWSSHEFTTAEAALRDLESLIEGSPDLARMVKRTSRGFLAKHGAVPVIELKNGARCVFKTRTKGGGRGLSGNKTILDEAFAVQAGQAGALLPIMLARPGAQVLWASSACRPESAVLWDQVVRGRAGARRMLYAEWCAPPPAEACRLGERCTHGREVRGCGCDDLDLIRGVHSAITRGRIDIQTVVDLRSLPPEEYCREIMGWHNDVVGSTMIMSLAKWSLLADEKSGLTSVSAFGVAVSHDRKWASIGAAGPAKSAIGRTHLELVDRRPGVDWVVERCKELAKTHRRVPFVVDDHGPAASLIKALKQARVPLMTTSTGEYADATEQFLDGVVGELFTHGPDEVIQDAVDAVQPRPMGDRFVLGRKASGDITALEGPMLAAWGASNYKRPTYVVDLNQFGAVDDVVEAGDEAAGPDPLGR
jgi:hypothetical protein